MHAPSSVPSGHLLPLAAEKEGFKLGRLLLGRRQIFRVDVERFHQRVVDEEVDGVAVNGLGREGFAELLGQGEDLVCVWHLEFSGAASRRFE